jgi:hypothetical protein
LEQSQVERARSISSEEAQDQTEAELRIALEEKAKLRACLSVQEAVYLDDLNRLKVNTKKLKLIVDNLKEDMRLA